MFLWLAGLERDKLWAHRLKSHKCTDSCSYKHKSAATMQLYCVSPCLLTWWRWWRKSDLLTGSFSCVLKTEKDSGSDSTATASCCCPHPLVWRDLTCVTCKSLKASHMGLKDSIYNAYRGKRKQRNNPNRTHGTKHTDINVTNELYNILIHWCKKPSTETEPSQTACIFVNML